MDEKGNECPAGVEGEVVVSMTPNKPVGLFTRYVVSTDESSGEMNQRNSEKQQSTRRELYSEVNKASLS